ncbi:hypothetical protein BJP36_00415 [Moorena producens JHB]|uniref:Uncharacterized protein n=1 Tax=Moorena producens (strain JHB) TaxID=1454205 RepID=A0A1D9FT70_MOOP1|nr:hypothetical protein [Moorena producens]AOY78571.1 hypothetical protein BJP36_00415 [Moorena producens JHB]
MFLGTGNLTVSIQLSAISYQRLALRARYLRCYQSSANALQMVLLEMLLNKTGKHWNNAELHLNKTGKHCFNLCYFSIRLTADC